MKKEPLLIIIILVCLSGCAAQPDKQYANSQEWESSYQTPEHSTPTFQLPADHQDPLDEWLGGYSFSEAWPHISGEMNYFLYYGVTVYKENDGLYYADIEVDGTQSIRRFKAVIQGDKKKVDLIFDSYRPDNIYELYEKGEILFSFEKEEKDILTYWGSFEAELLNNRESGKIYFVKD